MLYLKQGWRGSLPLKTQQKLWITANCADIVEAADNKHCHWPWERQLHSYPALGFSFLSFCLSMCWSWMRKWSRLGTVPVFVFVRVFSVWIISPFWFITHWCKWSCMGRKDGTGAGINRQRVDLLFLAPSACWSTAKLQQLSFLFAGESASCNLQKCYSWYYQELLLFCEMQLWTIKP